MVWSGQPHFSDRRTLAKSATMTEDALEGEAGAAPLNFYCRLPNEKTRAPDRNVSPAPMGWLKRILESYDQTVDAELQTDQLCGEPSVDGSSVADGQQSRGSECSSNEAGALASSASATHTHPSDGKGVEQPAESSEEEEEEPWFSQLAHLPQVRSAGVPLAAPVPGPTKRIREGASSKRPESRSRAGAEPTLSSSSMHVSSSSSSLDPITGPSSLSATSTLSQAGSRTNMLSSMTGSSISLTPAANGGATVAAMTTSTTDAPLIPPDNFAMVNSWVYRSSFPKKRHFPFLKTLGLRSVL